MRDEPPPMNYLVYVRHTEAEVTLVMLFQDERDKAVNLARFLNEGKYFQDTVLVNELTNETVQIWKRAVKLRPAPWSPERVLTQ